MGEVQRLQGRVRQAGHTTRAHPARQILPPVEPTSQGRKAKSRLVVQGFRDPHLPLLARDAAVLARSSLACLLQFASSLGLELLNADCKSAFLQGQPDDARPEAVYFRPPKDGIAIKAVPEWNNDIIYQMVAPVYGLSNAPRQWFAEFLGRMTAMGWRQHSLDPCLFLLVLKVDDGLEQTVGILGVHVDDIVACSTSDSGDARDKVSKAFE